MLLFLASMEKIQLKIAEIMCGQHFLHTKFNGVVCCHSNQSSDQSASNLMQAMPHYNDAANKV